jgi:hypothetical protein
MTRKNTRVKKAAVASKSERFGALTRTATIGSAEAIGSAAGSTFSFLREAGSNFAVGFKKKAS